LANQCANFHCDNIALGIKVRCGKCRSRGKRPLCCCCDSEVNSQRAFRCDPCKREQDNFKCVLWHQINDPLRRKPWCIYILWLL